MKWNFFFCCLFSIYFVHNFHFGHFVGCFVIKVSSVNCYYLQPGRYAFLEVDDGQWRWMNGWMVMMLKKKNGWLFVGCLCCLINKKFPLVEPIINWLHFHPTISQHYFHLDTPPPKTTASDHFFRYSFKWLN